MCGIFAIFSSTENKNIGDEIVNGMELLQHRGKDGYGIAYYNKRPLRCNQERGQNKYEGIEHR